MSLYSIAAASLTTPDDRCRQPGVDRGQVARTLVLCIALAVAMVVLHHRGRTAGENIAKPAVAPVAADGAPDSERS